MNGSESSDLDKLIQLAKVNVGVAVMCLEHLPENCHRGKCIEPDLKAKNIQVKHLVPFHVEQTSIKKANDGKLLGNHKLDGFQT